MAAGNAKKLFSLTETQAEGLERCAEKRTRPEHPRQWPVAFILYREKAISK